MVPTDDMVEGRDDSVTGDIMASSSSSINFV